MRELPAGEVGEIVIHGPQVFLGYWNKPEDSAQAFVEIDGKRFLRTGDLGRVDEDGYFFMVDRLKRMINASGFKVWPTEVESLMYQHPAVLEACVIGSPGCASRRDRQGGDRAAAGWRGRIEAQAIIDWCRENMAAYKCPRIVEFVEALPKSGAGKIMWRELQDREAAAANQRPTATHEGTAQQTTRRSRDPGARRHSGAASPGRAKSASRCAPAASISPIY